MFKKLLFLTSVSIMNLHSINILHVLEDLNLSGVHILKLNIINHLNSLGEFNNFCLAGKPGPMLERFLACTQVTQLVDVPTGSVVDGQEAGRWAMFCAKLSQMVKAHRIDIIHSGHWQTSLYSKIVAKRFGVKVIEDYHFLAGLWGEDWRREYDNATEAAFQPLFWRVCAAQGIADSFRFGEKGLAHRVIPNAVNADEFKFSQAARDQIRERHGLDESFYVFGAVGRLSQEKGFDTLINLFADFIEMHPFSSNHIHLIIVGDGPERAALEQLIVAKHLQDHVTLTGMLDNVAPYYSAFDLMLCTSRSEGFSLAVLAALAAGLPVASTIMFHGFEEILGQATLAGIRDTFLKDRPKPGQSMESFRACRLPEFYQEPRMLADYVQLYKEVAGHEG